MLFKPILFLLTYIYIYISGNGQCTLKDLKVRQSQTGFQIHGKPEWGVSITNNCSCVQKDVKLNCRGFQTTESVDPLALNINGDVCLLNNGNPIYTDAIKFKYAWDNSFPLNPISSQIACS